MVRAAAVAGFRMVGLRLLNGQPGRDPAPLLESAALRRETCACLCDTGLQALDASGARLTPETDMSAFSPFLEAAAAMGARHVLATVDDPDWARAQDRLGHLAELSADFGLTVDLEFVPWMTVSDIPSAAALVQSVGKPNLGIAVDALHFDRSRSKHGDLAALPRHWFRYLQLCDAPRDFSDHRDALLHAAVSERMFPGEGGIDLVALLRALPRGIPVALEIPTAALAREVPAAVRLKRAVAAARAVLAAAYD
ncbi:MAG: TIM barrel protein [Casimicrobiaceae bacterium]